MPTKTWVVGEEVLAADFNTYVQKQVVATFANAAARDSALPAPNEGMICYLTDIHQLQLRRATYWAPPPGTVVISTDNRFPATSFTGIGLRDILGVNQGRSFPFPVLSMCTVHHHHGFGGDFTNAQFDCIQYMAPNGVVATDPGITQAIGAAWTSGSISGAWAVPNNNDVGFKVRFDFRQSGPGGSNCYAEVTAQHLVIVT